MHKEILTQEQVRLLPLLKTFASDFGLVGGTAIALHIGHRRSIDFDLFTDKTFDNLSIRKKIIRFGKIDRVFSDTTGDYTMIVNGVKMTFFHYPFKISYAQSFDHIFRLPDLVTLAALKAYALGRRAKWKDYADLYFILVKYHSIGEIITTTKKIFKNEFNEKLFRSQLAYFKDIDYSEPIDFMKGYSVSNKRIEEELISFSLKK